MNRCTEPLRIYIAGPMSAPTEAGIDANVRQADHVARELFKRGHHPFCPHTQSHTWFRDPHPDIHNYDRIVRDFDFAWLRLCHAIYLLPGWTDSRGARMEVTESLRLDLQRFYSLDEVPILDRSDQGEAGHVACICAK